MKRLWFISLIVVMTGFFACKHEIPQLTNIDDGGGGGGGGEDCDPGTVYFQQQILPIFQSSCAVPLCHSVTDPVDDKPMYNYETIMENAEITGGQPFEGDLLELLNSSDDDERMPEPPYEPLDPDLIDLIQLWIEQGALNNSCASLNCDTIEVTFNLDIFPIIENSCQSNCHSGNSPQGNLSLNTYSQIATIAGNGSLYGAITDDGYTFMPYNGTALPDCQIEMIRIWIENGYPND